jgi:hypothetical protein
MRLARDPVVRVGVMVQIRNAPAELHRTFKIRAVATGMSMSEYLLNELRGLAERHLMETMRARLAALPWFGTPVVGKFDGRAARLSHDTTEFRCIDCAGAFFAIAADQCVARNSGPNSGLVVHVPMRPRIAGIWAVSHRENRHGTQ